MSLAFEAFCTDRPYSFMACLDREPGTPGTPGSKSFFPVPATQQTRIGGRNSGRVHEGCERIRRIDDRRPGTDFTKRGGAS